MLSAAMYLQTVHLFRIVQKLVWPYHRGWMITLAGQILQENIHAVVYWTILTKPATRSMLKMVHSAMHRVSTVLVA